MDLVLAGGTGSQASFGLWKTKDEMGPLAGPNLQNIGQLAAGTCHCPTLRSKGQVWAWGDNTRGQIGWEKKEHPPRPHRVPVLDNVRFIAAVDFSNLAIPEDGSLWARGKNRRDWPRSKK